MRYNETRLVGSLFMHMRRPAWVAFEDWLGAEAATLATACS